MQKPNKWGMFARGASLGLGMVPGVSAGTVAIVAGIYKKLIDALATIKDDFKNSWSTLWPILLGAIISSALILIAVHYAYDYAPFLISCIFGGFIAGTFPIISKDWKGKKMNVWEVLLVILGFAIAGGLGAGSAAIKLTTEFTGIETAFINGTWWTYLACIGAGLIAAIACIIPGISGSLILFIVGLYHPLVGIYSGDNSMFRNHARIGSGIGLTLCVLVGVIIGFIVSSKGMKKSIENHPRGTSSIVMGFVLGSIVSLFVNESYIKIGDNNTKYWLYQNTQIWEYIAGIVAFFVVFGIFIYLSTYHVKKISKSIDKN